MKQTQQSTPDLEETVETLQAVVRAQLAQIDVLLASLQGLMAGPDVPPPESLLKPEGCPQPDAALLGNPLDAQFACLHELMARLRAGP